MIVVKRILAHQGTLGGETHLGWLPKGATIPRLTPTRDVILNITIESDGAGYLLCWASSDLEIEGDRWYQTLADAERAATKNFAVTANQWQTPA